MFSRTPFVLTAIATVSFQLAYGSEMRPLNPNLLKGLSKDSFQTLLKQSSEQKLALQKASPFYAAIEKTLIDQYGLKKDQLVEEEPLKHLEHFSSSRLKNLLTKRTRHDSFNNSIFFPLVTFANLGVLWMLVGHVQKNFYLVNENGRYSFQKKSTFCEVEITGSTPPNFEEASKELTTEETGEKQNQTIEINADVPLLLVSLVMFDSYFYYQYSNALHDVNHYYDQDILDDDIIQATFDVSKIKAAFKSDTSHSFLFLLLLDYYLNPGKYAEAQITESDLLL